MKLASTTKKIIIATLSMASVVVAAGTFSDMQFNSNSFMNETKVEVASRLDDNGRNVSSVIENAPAVLAVEMTEANIKRINGIWNIYNIVGDEEKVNFNAKFELIAQGLVRVGGEQVYKISFLSDRNTIALFKEMGEGKYEIIEARKVETQAQMKKIVAEQKMMAQEGLTVNSKEIDLNVNTTATRLADKFSGKNASGSIRISNGMIVNFEMTLNGQHAISFDEAVEINDGGAFVAQANVGSTSETVSGIIINSGKESYTLRIATGEYQGTTIVFDSASEKVEENVQQVEAQQVEEAPAEAVQIQENIQNERKALMEAMDAQLAEKVAPATEQEQKEEISEKGFSFTNN